MSVAMWNLQVSVKNALSKISAPVYDNVPQNQKAAYVAIGESTSIPHSSDRETGFEATLTLHTWSTYRGTKEAAEIMGEIYDSLDRADLAIPGYTILGVDYEFDQIFLDPDGVTRHGVQRFRVLMTKQTTEEC